MRNRSLLNNDYADNFEHIHNDFSIEDNFLDDIRFNHDINSDQTYLNHDYTVYIHVNDDQLFNSRNK